MKYLAMKMAQEIWIQPLDKYFFSPAWAHNKAYRIVFPAPWIMTGINSNGVHYTVDSLPSSVASPWNPWSEYKYKPSESDKTALNWFTNSCASYLFQHGKCAINKAYAGKRALRVKWRRLLVVMIPETLEELPPVAFINMSDDTLKHIQHGGVPLHNWNRAKWLIQHTGVQKVFFTWPNESYIYKFPEIKELDEATMNCCIRSSRTYEWRKGEHKPTFIESIEGG